MSPNSPQFTHLLVCAVWTVLVLVFTWIHKRDREKRSRLWMMGWLAIEFHFMAGLAESFSWIPERLGDWLAYATLLAAASAFFLSVSSLTGSFARRTVFWSLLFAPSVAYWTLQVFDFKPHWPYIVTILTMTAASGTLAALHWTRLAIAGWLVLGAAPAIYVLSRPFEPGNGIHLILFQAFFTIGCAYWLRFRRLSPGVVLTSISFMLWGLVWPGGDLLNTLSFRPGDDSIIWDIPKYLAAFGMVITLFEEQANILLGQVRERENTEDALRQSEHWLRESQRVSRIGSYAVDMSSGFWKGSAIVDEILGLTPGGPRTILAWEQAIHPAHREEMSEHFRTEGLAGDQPFDRECLIRKQPGGEERWVEWRGAFVRSAAGDLTLTGTIQDITERKNIQRQLHQARKMESIGRLAGGVAHDFNNLLTVINGYSDVILKRLSVSDPLWEKVSEIRDAGARAADLTYQLLAFSRRQFLQPRVLDLNSSIAETERLLNRQIGGNIRVSTVLSPTLGKVEADPGQINQVLLNLSINARDAMPEGGVIVLETANVDEPSPGARPTSRPGSFVRVSITDTGMGMDKETQAQLFEPFFTTKPRGQGTGLGLSTAYGIVNQSGGKLRVRSEIGRGSTFEIYLPCVDAALAPESGRTAAVQEPAAALTILVAEDQTPVRNLICSILEDSGYRTLSAGSGEEALGLARAFPGDIALVVTDVVMPGISGPQLVDRLRQVRPETAAILISGYTDDVLASHRDLAFLHKPFSPEALRTAVTSVIEKRTLSSRLDPNTDCMSVSA